MLELLEKESRELDSVSLFVQKRINEILKCDKEEEDFELGKPQIVQRAKSGPLRDLVIMLLRFQGKDYLLTES